MCPCFTFESFQATLFIAYKLERPGQSFRSIQSACGPYTCAGFLVSRLGNWS